METKRIVRKAAVAVLLMVWTVQAILINSNSNIIDEIEYYVETDKAVYELGENVEMLYRVTNLSLEDVTFYFPKRPVYNFWVEQDSQNIKTAIRFWLTAITEFTLIPGQSKEFPDDYNPPYMWDMKDNNNFLVSTGIYDVVGGLDHGHEYSKVSVPIEIIPEPNSLILFITSGVILRKNKIISYNDNLERVLKWKA